MSAGNATTQIEFPAVPQGNFVGWRQTPSTEDTRELTRVGRGTPAGDYLRRFWQPVALTEELHDQPLALTILGEKLVLFRDRGGRLGLLHRHCSHRGASLEFGIIGERGIRCAYHGWKYDVDGTILEKPAVAAGSPAHASLCHGAYPVVEVAGLIFGYFGATDTMPPFPMLDAYVSPPGNEPRAYKLHFPCNWLQVHENGADPMHVPFVHALMSEVQFTEMFGALPVIDNIETPIGFISLATRRWGDNLYVRANDVILPNMAQFGTPFVRGEEEKFAVCAGITRWVVPIDDESNYTFGLRHFNKVIDPFDEGRRDLIGMLRTDGFGQTGDRPYHERQRNPGDWDVQMSQGKIAVHDNEHLVPHDSGVTLLRRMLRAGIRSHADGVAPPVPKIYPANNLVPTYVAEIVATIPRRSDDEQQVLQKFGRAVAAILVETQDLAYAERAFEVERRVRAIRYEDLAA